MAELKLSDLITIYKGLSVKKIENENTKTGYIMYPFICENIVKQKNCSKWQRLPEYLEVLLFPGSQYLRNMVGDIGLSILYSPSSS